MAIRNTFERARDFILQKDEATGETWSEDLTELAKAFVEYANKVNNEI